MEKKKTLATLIDEGADIFPSEVDALTKDEIIDWFQFRAVTDNQKAPTYIKRVLRRDYSRYRQLLRIEAGKQGDTGLFTNFDWLVTNYYEGYDRHITSRETGGTSTTSGSNSTNTTGQIENSGDDVTRHTAHDTFSHGHEIETTGTRSDTSNSTTAEKSGNETEARAGALSRTQPMSAEYSQADLNINDSRRGYVNKTANGYHVGEKIYTEGLDDEGYIVGLHRNFPELDIKNPTSASDTHTSTGSISSGDSTTTGQTTGTDKATTINSGTDISDRGGSDTTTHGHVIDSTSKTTGSTSQTGRTTGTENGMDTTEAQHTGRGGEIAEILKHAQDYIKTSSAFDWLRGQLESCFIANLDYEGV